MKHVQIRRENAIAIVSFDRGKAANALSYDLMRELTAAAVELAQADEIAAIVLTGRTDNFSMGFDLNDPETETLRNAPLLSRRRALLTGKNMCLAWENLPQLTVSAIEGWCVGGGVALAVATDLRVVAASGGFYVPEVERGLNMSWGSVPRIVNLIGPARAKRMIILAEKVMCERALDWGFADHTANDGSSIDAALELAERAAALPPVALRMCKQDINAYANALAAVASHGDHDGFAMTQCSSDAQEGIDAFLQKRPAKFTGD